MGAFNGSNREWTGKFAFCGNAAFLVVELIMHNFSKMLQNIYGI